MIKKEHFTKTDIDAINENIAQNYFTPVLLDVLNQITEVKSICDVGCGNGIFTANLKKMMDCKLVGVDGSKYALDKAGEFNFDELHHIHDFSSDTLPFDDGIFDLVINKDVLEHLVQPEHLVNEMTRITKGGGYVLIHVPNHFPVVGRLKLLFKNTIDPFHYFPESRRWNFPHIRFFNQKDFLDLMRSVGLEPIVNLCHHFPSFPKVGRFIPENWKNYLARKNPDLFAEGFTYLFHK